ncbi:PREDICTED: probable carboxylesterase 6 [Tarenaya hassleriana]|uniref:probable carboxylesterase 6 n=1 Tax=Tarenaya hassleriana TaxID=28532 RepID=UPI00053C6C39|nr:PREDICTED: probable carboxylesterase 6 [Tarenaya hassleriana]
MGATTLTHVTKTPKNNINNNKKNIHLHHEHEHGPVVDEVEGVLRVYKDGHVERSSIVPRVGPSLAPDIGVACSDVLIDKFTSVWARFYVPKAPSMASSSKLLLPLLVYFHGGGFCVGSASWSCYHDFLSRLSSRSQCLIMSVNYRLAPENPLPAAYDDGIKAVLWLKQHANPNYRDIRRRRSCNLWAKQCDFGRIFLAGDSAGGNIAHRVATTLDRSLLRPLTIEGTILIQPFFGGEERVESERRVTSTSSILSLSASDAYWRLALPRGTNRDHPFCNPLTAASPAPATAERMMVCVAEMDILRDREMEFCDDVAEKYGGQKVKRVIYRGVGHAFQILGRSQISQTRTHELMSHIHSFIHHSDLIIF